MPIALRLTQDRQQPADEQQRRQQQVMLQADRAEADRQMHVHDHSLACCDIRRRRSTALFVFAPPALGQVRGADHHDQQQHADDLERHQ